jgi:hypothetical protein
MAEDALRCHEVQPANSSASDRWIFCLVRVCMMSMVPWCWSADGSHDGQGDRPSEEQCQQAMAAIMDGDSPDLTYYLNLVDW